MSTVCASDEKTLRMAGVHKKLGLKNIGGFAVSQNAGAVQVAAYVPEGKGSPGFVGVWPLAQLSKHETPPPTARRSFFRVISPSPRREDFNLEGHIFVLGTPVED